MAGKAYPSEDDIAHMCRSERKRHREKKRRNQVNAGFDDLKALLSQIDPAMQNKEDINRVDLISRAVIVMKDMNEENERLKQKVIIQDHHGAASAPGGVASLADEITFAVPFLVPSSRQQQHHQEQTDASLLLNQPPTQQRMPQPHFSMLQQQHTMPTHGMALHTASVGPLHPDGNSMLPQHYFGSSFHR